MVMLFNDIIDIGDLDPTVLMLINGLVLVHLAAFVVLMAVVSVNMAKTDQTAFAEKVVKMHKEAAKKRQ
jgi:antibiotic biosynthesis monooxygenase (ABM) superfamily enzyme